jgi:glycerol uptake facilitator-like aquaporin/protein-tyrosine-phosphatase
MLLKKVVAEALGTALLLAAIVGSGIMGEELARPSVALALLANTVATGAALVALIITFGPISGAHFNPVVTLADASQGGLPWREVPGYIVAQVLGAFLGVAVAHVMFKQPALFFASQHRRDGIAQLTGELVATFGLLSVVWGSARRTPGLVPFAVGAYITAAYWFTSSTSFANPAVTLARAASDTFAGIRPADAPGFIAAQLAGGAAATAVFRWLVPALPKVADRVADRPGSHGAVMNTVIFACIHNAGRSQMAAAWFNELADSTKARAISAGTEPGMRVHTEVLDAMREVGVDLSDRKPQKLTDDLARGAQMLITMGCGEQCPVVPGLRRDDWPLEDPKGKPIARVREIRDDVRVRVIDLLRREGWARG